MARRSQSAAGQSDSEGWSADGRTIIAPERTERQRSATFHGGRAAWVTSRADGDAAICEWETVQPAAASSRAVFEVGKLVLGDCHATQHTRRASGRGRSTDRADWSIGVSDFPYLSRRLVTDHGRLSPPIPIHIPIQLRCCAAELQQAFPESPGLSARLRACSWRGSAFPSSAQDEALPLPPLVTRTLLRQHKPEVDKNGNPLSPLTEDLAEI